jgi:hypothetical protein
MSRSRALYVAIRSLSENAPRRLIAFLALSQSACILAGLESRTAEGISGALVHWIVVSISTMGLFGVLRLLEVRFGENLTPSAHLGLAEHAPRLAVFFLIFGLALVGLPGTLSFCSQDLLIHGTLKSHPQTGAASAHRHCDECHELFPVVHAAIPGQPPDRFHSHGGCPPARAMDFGGGCVVRGFGRIIPEYDRRLAFGGS